jgi:hypothetical protein
MLVSLQVASSCAAILVLVGLVTARRQPVFPPVFSPEALRRTFKYFVIGAWVSFVCMLAVFALVEDAKEDNLIDVASGSLRTGNAIPLNVFTVMSVYARWQGIMWVILLVATANVYRVCSVLSLFFKSQPRDQRE